MDAPSAHITPHIMRQLEEAATAAYPHECCGLLLGTASQDRERRIVAAEAAVNRAEAGRTADRYRIATRDYHRIDRLARQRGWDILGVYHSHPDGVPEPSPTDLSEAWPHYLYLILAVDKHRGVRWGGWQLRQASDGTPSCFEPVAIDLTNPG